MVGSDYYHSLSQKDQLVNVTAKVVPAGTGLEEIFRSSVNLTHSSIFFGLLLVTETDQPKKVTFVVLDICQVEFF